MRVLVLPADMGGCGNYRLIYAAEHLKAQGHDIIIQYPNDANSGFDVYFEGDTITDFLLPHEGIEVIVMQRVSHVWHMQALPVLRRKGIAVVVDMDDDLSSIHPLNKAHAIYSHRTATPLSHKYAAQICRDATYVTTSTNNLLKIYAKHGRGQSLDNYVPERLLNIQPTKIPGAPPRFGWGGTLSSHPVDLMACGRAVQRLIEDGHQFQVVGPPDIRIKKQLRLKDEPAATGAVSTFQWPTALADNLDVGMAPLEVSAFNDSKSRLKLLEYNAVGVPYVASSRNEYRRYHKESGGAGLLAETPKDWVAGIRALMTDDARRKELSERGREFAATQTIEQNSWRFLEAWTRAYEIQRSQ